MFGRFREKVRLCCSVVQTIFDVFSWSTAERCQGQRTVLKRSLSQYQALHWYCRFKKLRQLEAISVRPGVSASTKCIRRCVSAQQGYGNWHGHRSARKSCSASQKQIPPAQVSALALHIIALLQVHDFAQNMKQCERQLKQLEIASAGTRLDLEPRCVPVR